MSPLKALKELQEDISVVARKRAREEYSMDVSITKVMVHLLYVMVFCFTMF
jgi:hypothetical protein